MKIFIQAFLCLGLLLQGCQKPVSQEEQNTKILKEVFQTVVSAGNLDAATIDKYFDPSYTQLVDGKKLNREELVLHMKALHKAEKDIKVNFDHMVAQGNKVATVHHVHAKKDNGQEIVAKVIALFEFKHGRIILCDELTAIVVGDAQDKGNASKID